MKNFISLFASSSLALLVFAAVAFSTPVVRSVGGFSPTSITPTINQFRSDLGGGNNGAGGSFQTGRREINWDAVPDNFAVPFNLPVDFFNVNSPRGVVFSSNRPTPIVDEQQPFIVSAKASSGIPVRFGSVDASYTANFQAFSEERLFSARTSNVVDVEFFVPGTNVPATVSGFGAVFCDVDSIGSTRIQYIGADGKTIGFFNVEPANGGLSFLGVSFTTERVARVRIYVGNSELRPDNPDGGINNDVVAMDDFIYGEPRAAQFHAGDFDGDGFADPAVFRPSTGTFFVLNSGSNTVNQLPFGLAGDVPVNGDFDGDRRADVAIYRPSAGEWWINRSSDKQTVAAQFGQAGDKPVPGDFDKDGRTDIAFWRPSNGNYFVLRSKDGSFFSFPWGSNGDLPVGAAIVP